LPGWITNSYRHNTERSFSRQPTPQTCGTLPQLVTIGISIMAKNSIMPHRPNKPNRPKSKNPVWSLRGVLNSEGAIELSTESSWCRHVTEVPSPNPFSFRRSR
jgi:hypothetical protein